MTEHEKFREVLDKLDLSYKDLADKLGMPYNSLKSQVAPAKKLPKWAVSLVLAFDILSER